MADVKLYLGGTSDLSFMNCAGHPVTSSPPFGHNGWGQPIPRFNAHLDGIYKEKIGRSLIPSRTDTPARNNIMSANPGVGDVLQMLVIPVNHFVHRLRFDVANPDPNMVGVTVALTAQSVIWNSTTHDFDVAEVNDVTDAATAQGKDAPIDLGTPSTTWISLDKVANDYVEPLYVEPVLGSSGAGATAVYTWDERGGLLIGLKVLSLPSGKHIEDMLNDAWLTAYVTTFECSDTA